jgi:hypothetical protein
LGGKFQHFSEKEKELWMLQRYFWGENGTKSQYF